MGRTFLYIAKQLRTHRDAFNEVITEEVMNRGAQALFHYRETASQRLLTLASIQHAELLKRERYNL